VGIVLQDGCQVANRVTDVCGESVILWITSEISRQRTGCKRVCAVVKIKWFDFSKKAVFCNFFLAYLPCCFHLSRYFLWRGGSLERSGTDLMTVPRKMLEILNNYLSLEIRTPTFEHKVTGFSFVTATHFLEEWRKYVKIVRNIKLK
jgi:hypothetical protein